MHMEEGSLRIRKLLERWIEHNDEHIARFLELSEEVEKLGLNETSNSLRLAVETSGEVSKHLRKALNSM
jgi:hypothetical protein